VVVMFLHSRSSVLCVVLCVCGRSFVVFCAACFSVGRLPMMAIIGRNMQSLNFITKNIVALDGIQS
jgi:hypothetical protein